jgi:hypothetical protein
MQICLAVTNTKCSCCACVRYNHSAVCLPVVQARTALWGLSVGVWSHVTSCRCC